MTKVIPLKDLIQVYSEYSKSIIWDNEPIELYQAFDHILKQEGKKMRPISLLLCYSLFKDDLGSCLEAAYGFELFHNFTLIHDDIMDKAETRRGKLTVHKLFGEEMAILSGDTMLLESCRYLIKSTNSVEVLEYFLNIGVLVCKGQTYDLNYEKRDLISIPEYLNMISLKTSVLLAAAMKIGTQLANQNTHVQDQFYNLGIELGLAFQIQDDYFDLYGNEAAFGKKIGGDLIQRKKTILILKAIEKLSPADQQIFIEHYHSVRSETEQIRYYTNYFDQNNIRTEVQEMLEQYKSSCSSMIDEMNIENVQKDLLKEFAGTILERKN
ncbi:MAG: polyprenyl synthetase family protein [Saprospiraceae bacterium]